MKDIVVHGYDQAAEAYANNRHNFDNTSHIEAFATMLPEGAHVLDLGCGSGVPAAETLTGKGFQVTGIDISPAQIELARAKVPQANFEVGDMGELHHGQYEVEGIISLYAIYHLQRDMHDRLFRRLNSFLPVGGLLFALMGAKDWEGTKDNFYGVQMSWSMHPPERNLQIIEGAGFEVVSNELDRTGGERHQAIFARKITEIEKE